MTTLESNVIKILETKSSSSVSSVSSVGSHCLLLSSHLWTIDSYWTQSTGLCFCHHRRKVFTKAHDFTMGSEGTYILLFQYFTLLKLHRAPEEDVQFLYIASPCWCLVCLDTLPVHSSLPHLNKQCCLFYSLTWNFKGHVWVFQALLIGRGYCASLVP